MSRYQAAGASALVGIVAAAVGLLPWLVTDMELPLLGIARIYHAPEQASVALLPLSHFYLMTTVAMVLVGSALAGAVTRLAATRDKTLSVRFVVTGAVAVQVIALVQAASTLNDGIQPTSQGDIYLLAISVAVIVAIAAGALVIVGLARGGVPATTLATTVGALALGPWISAAILPLGGDWMEGVSITRLDWATTLSTLVPILIVGVVAGWCGASSPRRAAATTTAFVALWLVPRLITAYGVAVSSHTSMRDPQAVLATGTRMLTDLLVSSSAFFQLFIAATVAVVVAITMRTIRGGLPR